MTSYEFSSFLELEHPGSDSLSSTNVGIKYCGPFVATVELHFLSSNAASLFCLKKVGIGTIKG